VRRFWRDLRGGRFQEIDHSLKRENWVLKERDTNKLKSTLSAYQTRKISRHIE